MFDFFWDLNCDNYVGVFCAERDTRRPSSLSKSLQEEFSNLSLHYASRFVRRQGTSKLSALVKHPAWCDELRTKTLLHAPFRSFVCSSLTKVREITSNFVCFLLCIASLLPISQSFYLIKAVSLFSRTSEWVWFLLLPFRWVAQFNPSSNLVSPQNRTRFFDVGSPSNSRLPGQSLLPLHFKPEDPPLRPRSNRRNFEQFLPVGQHPELPAFNTIQLPPHPYYNPTTTTQDTFPTAEGMFNLNDSNFPFPFPFPSSPSFPSTSTDRSTYDPRLFNPPPSHHHHPFSLAKKEPSPPSLNLGQNSRYPELWGISFSIPLVARVFLILLLLNVSKLAPLLCTWVSWSLLLFLFRSQSLISFTSTSWYRPLPYHVPLLRSQ